MNRTQFNTFLNDQLADNNLRHEYENLEQEFQLAKEVIALRIARKLTQKELAQRMGTSQPAIARLESGTYRNLCLW